MNYDITRVARALERIADALERAYPKPSPRVTYEPRNDAAVFGAPSRHDDRRKYDFLDPEEREL